MPFAHSLEHAGEYPERPAFLFSHRTGKTSGRPANRRRNNAIFSADDELLVTGASGKASRSAARRADISFCSSSSVSSSRASAVRSASRSANRRRMRAISSEASFLSAKFVALAPRFIPLINIDQMRLGLKADTRSAVIHRLELCGAGSPPKPWKTDTSGNRLRIITRYA